MTATVPTVPGGQALRRRGSDFYDRYARSLLRLVLTYALLVAASAFILLPLGWMLTVALKPDKSLFFSNPPEWFPTSDFHWENFGRALLSADRPFLLYLLNTVWLEIFVVLGTVVSCALVAYPLARMRFRGQRVLFTVIVLTMLIPWQGLMIPQFLLFHQIGWYGTYLPLIVPSWTGSAFFIFLIRQYMRTIPKDLDDAARVDGLNSWQIFWRIILPLSTPVLTVCAVFTFLWNWNNLLGPLIYLSEDSKFTVAIGLANLITRADTPWNLAMAANLITILPCVIVYFFVQKRLIGGIASVGLKG